MKKLLVDVNVILDILLDRKPHADAAAAVWAAMENGLARGVLTAHGLTTIHYVARHERGAAAARRTVGAILQVLGVATVDGAVIQRAFSLSWPDFEDSVTAAAAEAARCDAIVTRDPKGFPNSPVRALTPEAAAALVRT